jgi:hypothetical protein
VHGIRPRGDRFDVGLRRHERALLRSLCIDLAQEVSSPPREDEGLARLFPAAYRDDDEAAREFEQLVRPGLSEGKVAALRLTADTARAEQLDEETAQSWLTALNDLRLVHGTRLGVTEHDYLRALRDREYAVYAWLTWLQSELIDALSV